MTWLEQLRDRLEVDKFTSLQQDAAFDFFTRMLSPLPLERLDFDQAQDPDPMDTLGSLIDKLITVDLKMWHNQEVLYAIRRMNLEQFIDAHGGDMSGLHQTIKRCCDLNVQRASLMDAIDKHFAKVVNGEAEAAVREQHKTY